MRLGRRHLGRARQILQGQRATVVREGNQQLATDLDALDAARAARRAGIGEKLHCHDQQLEPEMGVQGALKLDMDKFIRFN
jgi:hypothetical protein